jgi:hypothetical protein
MKTLDQLSNKERAELLFTLFPESMINVIAGIKRGAKETIENEKDLRANWSLNLITPDTWLSIARDVLSDASKLDEIAKHKPQRVAALLFDGYSALLSVHLLKQCQLTEKPKALVNILF